MDSDEKRPPQGKLAFASFVQYPRSIRKERLKDRMRRHRSASKWSFRTGMLAILAMLGEPGFAQVASNAVPAPVVVLEMEGTVEISVNEGQRWFACRTNEVLSPGDRL